IPKSDQHLQSKADWTVFCGEVVVGIKLTSGAVSLIKLLYKTATQGLDDVLDGLDEGPSSLFDALFLTYKRYIVLPRRLSHIHLLRQGKRLG
ncbi:hypothetical protein FOFC_05704, partial [Fusarium oxysporum]